MPRSPRIIVVTVILASLALTACAPAPGGAEHVKPARLEAIPGSDLKRVVLTEKAAERLGIETATVREEQVVRTRSVGGEVVAPPAEAGGEVHVRVRLNPSDLNQVDRGQPVLIRALDDEDDDPADDLEAEEDEAMADDDEDADDGSESLYYTPVDGGRSLAPGQRVWVRLSLVSSGGRRKIVPYTAVIYDLEGNTWVYTNPEPLVFVRHAVSIDFIEDGQAYLTDGPDTGTAVVTVGGAELYGTEVGLAK